MRPISGLAEVQIRSDQSFAGGGSLPAQSLPTWIVAVRARSLSDAELARRLRGGAPPVVARVQDGLVFLDLRTIFEEQEALLAEALERALRNVS